MKFFKFNLPSISRPLIFIVASFLAFAMWYTVVNYDMTDFEIDVIVNYRGLPNKLFVTNGLVYHVKERVRGPKMLKNALPETVELPIDISGLKVGDSAPSNVFSVVDEQRKLMSTSVRRAFKILYVDPPVIKLFAEHVDRINMPVRIDFISDSQIFIRNISHQSISFHGPESEIKQLENMSVFPLNVTVDFLEVDKKTVTKDIPIVIPKELNCPHVSADPSSIKVEYVVKGERVKLIRLYPVTLSVADASIYRVAPDLIQVSIKVPATKEKDEAYLNELRVNALPPPDLKVGETTKVDVNFTPPDGMEVINEHQKVAIMRVPPDTQRSLPVVGPALESEPVEETELLRKRQPQPERATQTRAEQAQEKKSSSKRAQREKRLERERADRDRGKSSRGASKQKDNAKSKKDTSKKDTAKKGSSKKDSAKKQTQGKSKDNKKGGASKKDSKKKDKR